MSYLSFRKFLKDCKKGRVDEMLEISDQLYYNCVSPFNIFHRGENLNKVYLEIKEGPNSIVVYKKYIGSFRDEQRKKRLKVKNKTEKKSRKIKNILEERVSLEPMINMRDLHPHKLSPSSYFNQV